MPVNSLQHLFPSNKTALGNVRLQALFDRFKHSVRPQDSLGLSSPSTWSTSR